MNDKRHVSQRPQTGLTAGDIYHVLFRHKWKIIVLSCLGLIAAAGIYVGRKTSYESEAEVMIKYVRDDADPLSSNQDGQRQQVTGGPEGLISSEMAILASYDLAMRVATNVGPAKILAKYGGGDDAVAAASLVHNNLLVERLGRSSVLRIVFSHLDHTVVQPILKSIIDAYQTRHLEIHGAVGSSLDSLMKQTGDIHEELRLTEEKLETARRRAGVIDIEANRKANEGSAAQIHFQIISTQAELEQHKAMLAKLRGTAVKVASSKSETTTNVEAEIPREKIDHYTKTTDFLNNLNKAYYDLRAIYPEHNTLVQEKLSQIKETEKLKNQLEQEEPRLVKQKVTSSNSSGQNTTTPAADAAFGEEEQVAGLESKLKVLQVMAAELNASTTNLEAEAPVIRDLERNRGIQEEKYKYFLTRLQNEKLDSDISASRNANIVPTEDPTPPVPEHAKTSKMMGMAVAVGLLAGLAWAFLVELVLDHTVKRAKEVEGESGMRLFLSIPDVNRNGHRRLAIAAAKETERRKEEPDADGAAVLAVNGNGKLEIAPWDAHHAMHNYYEALRDRLISYFEVNNLNHKPKLVAVSGTTKGSGTTTIAAGLAASLSETGDGNVLLVDMNIDHGGAQQFYKGKPGCELDAALENETRDTAMVQDNFYVVTGKCNGDQLSGMLPKRFANLIPKLKASDYDYIIFDMPPIGRTGVTQRLAGFMDMTLLVVEAEKTSRDVVRQAGALLAESKANVSVVLNKTKTYIPARLHQEF